MSCEEDQGRKRYAKGNLVHEPGPHGELGICLMAPGACRAVQWEAKAFWSCVAEVVRCVRVGTSCAWAREGDHCSAGQRLAVGSSVG